MTALTEADIAAARRSNIMARAARVLEIAAHSAITPQGRAKIENIELNACGYAEPGYDGDVIALADWNHETMWSEDEKRHVVVDSTIDRVQKLFERMGIEIEWSDQWMTCDGCNKLLRHCADSYGWLPAYTVDDDNETLCIECTDAEEHFARLENKPNKMHTMRYHFDPKDYGYQRLEQDYERGMHPGQDADPRNIAKLLRQQGIQRFLFQNDDTRQFDFTFSVWVHADEWSKLDQSKLTREAINGPSISGRMQAGLQAATAALGKLEGDGVRVAEVREDGTAEARLVSREDFIAGKAFDK